MIELAVPEIEAPVALMDEPVGVAEPAKPKARRSEEAGAGRNGRRRSAGSQAQARTQDKRRAPWIPDLGFRRRRGPAAMCGRPSPSSESEIPESGCSESEASQSSSSSFRKRPRVDGAADAKAPAGWVRKTGSPRMFVDGRGHPPGETRRRARRAGRRGRSQMAPTLSMTPGRRGPPLLIRPGSPPGTAAGRSRACLHRD